MLVRLIRLGLLGTIACTNHAGPTVRPVALRDGQRIALLADATVPVAWRNPRPRGDTALVELASRKLRFYVQLGCSMEAHGVSYVSGDTLFVRIRHGLGGDTLLPTGCFCGPCDDHLFAGSGVTLATYALIEAVYDDSTHKVLGSAGPKPMPRP